MRGVMYLIYALSLIILCPFAECQSESSDPSSVDNFSLQDYDPDEDYCFFDPARLFYQNRETGAICCRGKVLPMVNVIKPQVSGDCAISTKTATNGTLNPAPLVR